MSNIVAKVEALLFVAGDDGLSAEEIGILLEIDAPAARQSTEGLQEKYENDESSALKVIEIAGKFNISTKPIYAEILKEYAKSPISGTLSNAVLETLSIIAYKQPVTRSIVDAIRGVGSSNAVQKLLSFGLIEVAGRLETPGRPKLYRTTDVFMNHFGLADLAELPDIKAVEDEYATDDAIDLFSSRYSEEFEIQEVEVDAQYVIDDEEAGTE
ncbi:MAG: SMC-Scp complex subunit ScpB [Lactobacillales bacterium]|jgi:segregation and condensation protein B|nr:SMC-Scp complex subunit ScpB [Lactobacillales bacterium]